MTTWAFALFALIPLGAFLALFIYSIVAKKYWLSTAMVVVPVVLVLMLMFISIPPQKMEATSTASTNGKVDDRRFQLTDIAWSDSLPPTADIYPSISSCGRPLAFQIAEQIRQDKRSKKKFAVTFVKEAYSGDNDQWKPPEDFVTEFRSEFVKQIPGSNVAAETGKTKPANQKLLPLEIKLSFKPIEKIRTGKQIAGTISARWTTRNGTRAVALVDFIDKPWVLDQAHNNTELSVGYSKRLARSPAEAATLARESVQADPAQAVDRFRQKLSLPFGELWQEAVLVNKSIQPSSTMRGFRDDLLPLLRDKTNPSVATVLRTESQTQTRAWGFIQSNGWIITLIGLIAIGFISNLLTQGYYRQNINLTVITGVAVVIGLILLAMVMG